MAISSWKKFFDFTPSDKNRVNGLCRLCQKNYKDQHGIYSNFLKHLKRVHPIEYKQIFHHQNECSMNDENVIVDEKSDVDLTSVKYRQDRIVSSITKNLIIKCNLPLNLVENPWFRAFMKDCNVKCEPVSTKKVKHAVIPSMKNQLLKTIHEKLHDVNHLTLTIDGWCDRRCRSFLGATCHFLDKEMMPETFLIDFVRFKSPHTGENIRQLTEEILDRYNIKEKIFKIVTDNASNMVNAYKFGLFIDEEVEQGGDQSNSTSKNIPIFEDYDRK